ncbi:CRTAC1 family protein [Micromonospora sp. FIMYZ51]|uniref:CRTAC1 family protein n=1 Tax=Micromonospora sp. FIMYZ51 TaxID=3051832 RepID=UPI00311EA6B3
MSHLVRKILVPSVGILLCVIAGVATRQPQASGAELTALSARFSFTAQPLNATASTRTMRPVQPALDHMAAWISAVGASVGLADLDGDGLPNDRCLVDPRDDSVTLAPLPGTGERYAPIALLPTGVGYDEATTAPMGCLPADLNEDGGIDVLVYFWGRPPLLYLRTDRGAPGAGSYRPVDIADPGEVWNSTTANVADLDGDGHLDLLIGNYFPDDARVLDPTAVDDDAMQMQDSMSLGRNGGNNRLLLYENVTRQADGVPVPTYRDRSDVFTVNQARAWTLATGAQDLTGDGLPELYVANDFGPDNLLVNESTPGRPKFREVTGVRDPRAPKSKVVGHDSFKGMGVAFDDLNADGRPDVLVSNITTPYALHESNFAYLSTGAGFTGDRAPFRDRSEELGLSRSGWAWDIKSGDFDADGAGEVVQAVGFLWGDTRRWAELQELAMANDAFLRHPWAWPKFGPGDDLSGHEQNPFYVRGGDGRFVDIAERLDFANSGASRGIAVGDVDHDGRLDLAIANQWATSQYFRNTGPVRRHLGLRLVIPAVNGTDATRAAVGAAVEVRRSDGTTLRSQLYPANGHTGVNADELYFGLGDSTSADVRITWRDADGQHQMRTTLAAGWHTVRLRPTA